MSRDTSNYVGGVATIQEKILVRATYLLSLADHRNLHYLELPI